MGNRVKVDGVWHDISNLSEYPLSRLHSVTYPDGCVWQIAFGTTVLELTPDQGFDLKGWLSGVEKHETHGT